MPADRQVDEEAAVRVRFLHIEAAAAAAERRGRRIARSLIAVTYPSAAMAGSVRLSSSLLRPSLLSAQAGEAHRTTQFPGLRVLPARGVDALLDGRLGPAHRPGAGEQSLALEAIKLRFKRR